MNLVFYSDPFARKTPFGTGRYARFLLEEMRNIDPQIKIRPVSTWSDCNAEEIKALQQKYGYYKIPISRKITASAWAFLKFPKLETYIGQQHDLVHNLEAVYPVVTKKPLVTTIHDLGPLTHPDLFTSVRPWLMEMGLKHVIKHADQIICVSAATADAFTDYYKLGNDDRVQVVHEGINPCYLQPSHPDVLKNVKNLPPKGTPFLMTMGAISPRKNLNAVVAALEKLCDEIPHHLVHVGIPHWDSDDFFTKLKSSKIAHKVHLPGYLDDAEVNALYRQATAYIFPSLFEGFGLPILEAMACGCPVITSDRSSMPEIAGDAALLIDPTSSTQMTEAIQNIATSTELQKELKLKGLKRAQQFSWKRCAYETFECYKHII